VVWQRHFSRVVKFEANLDSPESGEAALPTADSSHSSGESALEQVEGPEYDAIRELLRFHLAASFRSRTSVSKRRKEHRECVVDAKEFQTLNAE
jgi:hypothetical protein